MKPVNHGHERSKTVRQSEPSFSLEDHRHLCAARERLPQRNLCTATQLLLSAEHALPPVTAKTTPMAHLCRFAAGRSCSESTCGHCFGSESPHMLSRALRKTKRTESAYLWRLWEAGAAGRLSLSENFSECWYLLSVICGT